MNQVVAERALVYVTQSGERTPFTLRLGTPYHDPRGNWACPVALDGLEGPILDIAGEDSLQSLMLAREFLHRYLAARCSDGSRVLDAEAGHTVSLAELFGAWP